MSFIPPTKCINGSQKQVNGREGISGCNQYCRVVELLGNYPPNFITTGSTVNENENKLCEEERADTINS